MKQSIKNIQNIDVIFTQQFKRKYTKKVSFRIYYIIIIKTNYVEHNQ